MTDAAPKPAKTPLTDEDRKQVRNERLKLTASALDRASTACLVVGLINPAAAGLANSGSILSTILWLSGALILHLIGRTLLGGIRK